MATRPAFTGPENPPDVPDTSQGTTALGTAQGSITGPKNRPVYHGILEIELPEVPEMAEKYTEGLPLLISSDADTLVYIDPPPASDHSVMACPKSTVPIRVHSRNLLKTGSTYFQKFFQPTYQLRTIKRRGLAGRLPDGVKYVIDLTPPTTEDEAVVLIMELSCPLGVRTWASKQTRWRLPRACVGGQDELEPVEGDGDSQKGTTDSKAHGAVSKVKQENSLILHFHVGTCEGYISGTAGPKSAKKPGVPVEYSTARHWRGVEQILRALESFEVILDTPCKVWTFFALAKIFEVATAPRICDRILAWFYEDTNTWFFEIHPEVTFRVACGVKCSSLCQLTFAILVGEDALLLLSRAGKETGLTRPKKTLHGRLRETLDDTMLQRIEHASKSFMDYVLNRFVYLVGAEMPWLAQLEECRKLLSYPVRSERHQETNFKLMQMLKCFVRGYICSRAFPGPESRMQGPGPYPTTIDDDYPPKGFKPRFHEFRCIERLMTRTFWDLVRNEDFRREWPLHCIDIPISSMADLGHLPAFKGQKKAEIRYVAPRELEERLEYFNTELASLNSMAHNGQVPFVDLAELLPQIKAYVSSYASQMTQRPQASEFPLQWTDTLVCLTENEYKFLPLWAGGNDDGSDGVFTDNGIPIPKPGGLYGPGPAIHTDSSEPSQDSYSFIADLGYESTLQSASHHATASHHTAEHLSMASIINPLHDHVEEHDTTNHDHALAIWQTEDNAPSPAPSDSDERFDPFASDDDYTIGKRESISDFLFDNDALEPDLEYDNDLDYEGDESDGW